MGTTSYGKAEVTTEELQERLGRIQTKHQSWRERMADKLGEDVQMSLGLDRGLGL